MDGKGLVPSRSWPDSPSFRSMCLVSFLLLFFCFIGFLQLYITKWITDPILSHHHLCSLSITLCSLICFIFKESSLFPHVTYMNRKFLEVVMARDVGICSKPLNGQSPHLHILWRLLQDLINEKACNKHRFYLRITPLKSIGNNNDNEDSHQASSYSRTPSHAEHSCLHEDILPEIVKKVS